MNRDTQLLWEAYLTEADASAQHWGPITDDNDKVVIELWVADMVDYAYKHLRNTVQLWDPNKLNTGVEQGRGVRDPKSLPAMVKSMEKNGFNPNNPVLAQLPSAGDTWTATVFDGNHRVNAAREADIKEVPVIQIDHIIQHLISNRTAGPNEEQKIMGINTK